MIKPYLERLMMTPRSPLEGTGLVIISREASRTKLKQPITFRSRIIRKLSKGSELGSFVGSSN